LLSNRAKSIADNRAQRYNRPTSGSDLTTSTELDSEGETLEKISNQRETYKIRRMVSTSMSSLDLNDESNSYLKLLAAPE
jgi:hypothetical protein